MPKRYPSPIDPDLYQFKVPDGNYYFRQGAFEHNLETNDLVQAQANKKYHEAISSVYGALAFKSVIGQLFPKYLQFMKLRAERKELRETYVSSVEWNWETYLKKYWEKKKLVDVKQATWDDYCEKIQRQFRVRAFNNQRTTMTGFLTWANQKGFILVVPRLKNPAHKVRKRKIIKNEHLHLIFENTQSVRDWEQDRAKRKPSKKRRPVGKLSRVILPGGLRLFLAFALFSGMRRSEITKLEWSWIDFDRRCLLLPAHVVKTNEDREIPLNDHILDLLIERIRIQQTFLLKTIFVFPNAVDQRRPMTPAGFKTSWKSVNEKARIKDLGYTWHDFRATFETHMHKAHGFTDTQREKMVGASIDVQKSIYVNMTADDLRGLENVVNVPGLSKLLAQSGSGDVKTDSGENMGKDIESEQQKAPKALAIKGN